MAGRRFLLIHITTSSGHHHASLALAHGLRRLDPDCQIVNVDAFDYTTRVIRTAITRTYHSMIRYQPDVWAYLYDNPAVYKRVRHLRKLVHRYHTKKLQRLLETVQPHAIACTQAFPCGMVADFKRHQGLQIPLVGVLTDYAPHLYWIYHGVDHYVVPAHELKERFVAYGISASHVFVYGIPIEPRFSEPVDQQAVAARFGLDPTLPTILLMGGGGGFGPLRQLMLSLDRLPAPCQFVALTGTNRALRDWFEQQRFRHRVVATGYVDVVSDLMAMASLVITKPGGLTTAETLARGVPMAISTPIPGQEVCNARYLLAHQAAIELQSAAQAAQAIARLLEQPEQLAHLRERARSLAHPDSAMRIGQLLIDLADREISSPLPSCSTV